MSKIAISAVLFCTLFYLVPAFAQQAPNQVANSHLILHAGVPVPFVETDKPGRAACIFADQRYTEGAVIRSEGVTLICAPREEGSGVHAGPPELVWRPANPRPQPSPPKAGVRSSAAK